MFKHKIISKYKEGYFSIDDNKISYKVLDVIKDADSNALPPTDLKVNRRYSIRDIKRHLMYLSWSDINLVNIVAGDYGEIELYFCHGGYKDKIVLTIYLSDGRIEDASDITDDIINFLGD